MIGRFDPGRITSDDGGLLLREVDKRIGLLDRLAGCFSDYHNPNAIEHSVAELVAQRVYGLTLGHENLNDHEAVRKDSVLALLVGKQDLDGERRVREQDRDISGRFTQDRKNSLRIRMTPVFTVAFQPGCISI